MATIQSLRHNVLRRILSTAAIVLRRLCIAKSQALFYTQCEAVYDDSALSRTRPKA
jgi:hypothetical protein